MASASEKTDFVTINSIKLKPAPNFTTEYEYNKSGSYTLSGFLIVNLDGQIIDKNINAAIQTLATLQTTLECVGLTIGCQNKFIENAFGRVRSVSIKRVDNQPYTVGYNIVIAIETIDGKPVIEPDPTFIKKYDIPSNLKDFISSYEEELSVSLEADNLFLYSDEGLTKSAGKITGSINVSCYAREVCGKTDYDGVKNSVELVKNRIKNLLKLNLTTDQDHPLNHYASYKKYLTTKSINISETNGVKCSFELILAPDSDKEHSAVAEINEEGSNDIENTKQNHKISGTIKGLISHDEIGEGMLDTAGSKPRINNADSVLGAILPKTISGNYSTIIENLTGEEGGCEEQQDDGCNDQPPTCYQRISSNISRSVVDGSIDFDGEYGDIGACQTKGAARIEVSIDETLPAIRFKEFIIPSYRPIVQILGDTPHTVNITVRGNLDSCDPSIVSGIIPCVDEEFQKNINKFAPGFLYLNQQKTLSNNSYSRTASFIKCG